MTPRDVLVAAELPQKTVFTRGFYAAAARTDAEASDAALAALGANGYVVVPEPLLKELVEAWTNDGNITRCDNAAQALVAAVVEAVGPTT